MIASPMAVDPVCLPVNPLTSVAPAAASVTSVTTTAALTNFLCSHPGCTKTFTLRSNMRRHVLTHSGIKPFKCDICPKVRVCKE